MFLGHFAVGFASKRWARNTNLGWLLLAPLLLDALWPLFVLLGLERFQIAPTGNPFLNLSFEHYPWSHSLLMAVGWGVLLALLWYRAKGDRVAAGVLGAGVVSHWLLDWITHLPDMPLWPGGPLAGLGLWNSVAGTVAVEVAMLGIAALLYLRVTRSRDRIGAVGIWAYLALLGALYVESLLVPPPPPGSERTIAMVALLAALLAPLAGWIDRHREPVPA